MISSAIVALDGSDASIVAQNVALSLARTHGIFLTGLGVVDQPDITAPSPTPMGAGHSRQERDQALLAKAQQWVQDFLSKFREQCEKDEIPHQTLELTGHPWTQIETEAQQHDLIIMGRNTNFQFATQNERGETFSRIISDIPRPVLATPDAPSEGDGYLVAYDGSLQAARSLQLFKLLKLDQSRKSVTVLTIKSNEEEAARICNRACNYLGYDKNRVKALPIVSSEKPSNIVLNEIEAIKPRALVMGAYSDSGVKRLFLGSTTARLIKKSPVPIFIYH
jgi:nucleotide-binding universal stress UspA family protein